MYLTEGILLLLTYGNFYGAIVIALGILLLISSQIKAYDEPKSVEDFFVSGGVCMIFIGVILLVFNILFTLINK